MEVVFGHDNHCGETEPCADDTYCNCDCRICMVSNCYRPGCSCCKTHVLRDRLDNAIRNRQSMSEKKVRDLEIERRAYLETAYQLSKGDACISTELHELVEKLRSKAEDIAKKIYG